MATRIHWVATLSVLVAGCSHNALRTPPGPNDFEVFPTPRTADGPGTVFQVNQNGARTQVAGIKFKVRDSGEAIPIHSSYRKLSFADVLKSAGIRQSALPESAKAKLTEMTNTKVDAITVRRLYVNGPDIEPILLAWAEQTKPKGKTTYYLIRETMITTKLAYSVSKRWLASLGVDYKVLRAAGYAGRTNKSDIGMIRMDRKFFKSVNVWFKAEKIDIKKRPGSESYSIVRTPVPGARVPL